MKKPKRFCFSLLSVLAGSLLCAVSRGQDAAGNLIETTGVSGGLAVQVGCASPEFLVARYTRAGSPRNGWLVHVLDTDSDRVKEARDYIRSAGIYGQISIDTWDGKRLPYEDDLVNFLLLEGGDAGVADHEVTRVLAPGGRWISDGRTGRKPVPSGMGEWTHFLHGPDNNAVGVDRVVGPASALRWTGGPRWARTHEHIASLNAMVSANGRIFYVMDEGPIADIKMAPDWKLTARDGFSGVVLWKRQMSDWYPHTWPLKWGAAELPRRLVAKGDRLYLPMSMDAPVCEINAATGKTIRTFEGSEQTSEIVVSGNTILMFRNPSPSEEALGVLREYEVKMAPQRVGGRHLPARPETGDREVRAYDIGTGRRLWTRRAEQMLPMTLAADGTGVCIHDGKAVVCMEINTGNEIWRTPSRNPEHGEHHYWYAPTLVMYKDTVLYAEKRKPEPGVPPGKVGMLTAFSRVDGRQLWETRYQDTGYQSPSDVLVIDDLVWVGDTRLSAHSGIFSGYDRLTGKVEKQIVPSENLRDGAFHHRCYRTKATGKYILPSSWGIEYVNTRDGSYLGQWWVRGGCLYGIMPSNGLIYTPPHSCACYLDGLLNGFCALAPETGRSRGSYTLTADSERLLEGKAYDIRRDQIDSGEEGGNAWPTYRHDSERSGCINGDVPSELTQAWECTIGGKLTQPVSDGISVYVASVNEHTVYALSAATGKVVWSFTAGGRIDSSPTLYKGKILFGCADGKAYCLVSSGPSAGKLIWSFIAAPRDSRIYSYGQLESPWPVHGSILVRDDTAYLCAGRNTFLDGGISMYKLDVDSGEVLKTKVFEGIHPEKGQGHPEKSEVWESGFTSDVISCSGSVLFMGTEVFDMDLNRLKTMRGGGWYRVMQRKMEQAEAEEDEALIEELNHRFTRIFSPIGMLDDSWWYRAYWVYGPHSMSGCGGWWLSGNRYPSGRIAAFNDSSVFGFGRKGYPGPNVVMWGGGERYHLFAANRDFSIFDKPDLFRAYDSGEKDKWKEKSRVDWATVPGTSYQLLWSDDPGLSVRAMVLADDVLFVAGPVAHSGRNSHDSSFWKGEHGIEMYAVSAGTGEILNSWSLSALPVFDGMSAIEGRLFAALENGSVVCLTPAGG